MKSCLNPLCHSDVRVDTLCRHSETMMTHVNKTDSRSNKKTSDDEPKFLGTESISKLLCHCARESTSPRFQKKAVRNFVRMNSISKSFQEESKPKKDTPAVKGILTLFFCIVYAAVLFIMAAVLSRVASSFGKSAASTPGVQIQMWETDTKKHMEVRQNRLAHTRWGQ